MEGIKSWECALYPPSEQYLAYIKSQAAHLYLIWQKYLRMSQGGAGTRKYLAF